MRDRFRHPAAESEPAGKEQQPGDQTVEQVESADSSHTDEEEQRAFHSEIREGLVQALVDPVRDVGFVVVSASVAPHVSVG